MCVGLWCFHTETELRSGAADSSSERGIEEWKPYSEGFNKKSRFDHTRPNLPPLSCVASPWAYKATGIWGNQSGGQLSGFLQNRGPRIEQQEPVRTYARDT